MKRLAAALVLLFASAGAAQAKNLRYDVSAFTSVEAARGVQVEVRQGAQFLVRAEGDDADRVAVRLSGSELKVARRGLFSFGEDSALDAKVFVTMPRVTGLTAIQGASLSAYGVRAGVLRVSASQGGQLSADGACTQLTASASMGGLLQTGGLECDSVDATASMGGLVNVHARSAVDANASMGGQITVAGAPASTNLRTTMGGAVSID
jgi:Putative auto-transporter adhesin, head GIN domain